MFKDVYIESKIRHIEEIIQKKLDQYVGQPVGAVEEQAKKELETVLSGILSSIRIPKELKDYFEFTVKINPNNSVVVQYRAKPSENPAEAYNKYLKFLDSLCKGK